MTCWEKAGWDSMKNWRIGTWKVKKDFWGAKVRRRTKMKRKRRIRKEGVRRKAKMRRRRKIKKRIRRKREIGQVRRGA